MRRKILFRADAGQSIGYGHFIRTLALADMLKDDFDCVFYTQEPSEYQKKEMEAVCTFRALPADDTRFELFLNQLEGDEIVVLDNYFYTTDYQKKIKEKGCNLVCIDDMHDKHYVADVVINQALTDPNLYSVEKYTQLCLGFDYAMLRAPFLRNFSNTLRKNQIVVCFGGADPFRITDKVVSLLLQLNLQQEIIIIKGDSVYLSDTNISKIIIKKNLSALQMADLFDESALGILSCSTVFLEAISRKMPVVVGYYVDNQKEYYNHLERNDSVATVGNLKKINLEILANGIAKSKNKNISIEFCSKKIRNNYLNLFTQLSQQNDKH